MSEEITENDIQSSPVFIDKIDYLSSVTDSAGNITLRYQVRRAKPMNEADSTPSVHDASKAGDAPLSDEETMQSNLLTSQLLNVQADPDMEAAMTNRKAHETAFEELKTIVAGPCTLVAGTDFDRHKALMNTRNTMTCMYATLDALESADDDDAGIGTGKSAMKQDLREMIDAFLASLRSPAHPWPQELKELVTSLMRDLAEKMDGASPPPVAKSDTPSSPTGGYKQRWKQVINLASSHMRPEDTEGARGFGASKKSKQRQINLLPRQDIDNGELDTIFLMTSIDKIDAKINLINFAINPGEKATSDEMTPGEIRNVLKDVHEDLTEFLDRWNKPTAKDKLAAGQLSPGIIPKTLVYFAEVNDKINIWFSNNLRNDTSPTNTPEKSPGLKSEFNSPFSKYGKVVLHPNPIVQKSTDDDVVEPQEKRVLPK